MKVPQRQFKKKKKRKKSECVCESVYECVFWQASEVKQHLGIKERLC